jgi:hypothetical protein
MRIATAAGALLLIGAVAQERPSACNTVVLIDGADVVAGDPEKFACNNPCKQNVGPGCVPTQGVTCQQGTIGHACGEEITKVHIVMGCEVNPAGIVDPCRNAKPPAKCYEAKGCVCFVKFLNGQPQYGCAVPPGTNATARGDTVGSDDC